MVSASDCQPLSITYCMYYPDLSPYCYGETRTVPHVLNVGWLEFGHGFGTGDVDADVLAKLRYLAVQNSVRQMRGFHDCPFCGSRESRLDKASGVLLGSAEIWVPRRDGGYFAAPDLLLHYIDEHRYLPPKEFLDAVSAMTEDALRRDLDAECQAALRSRRDSE